jgi:exosortase J
MLRPSPRTLDPRLAVALACVCAVAGLFTIYGTVFQLLNIWHTDDLKSMGLVVPFISFALILRAWRSIGWEIEGSWWGFAILVAGALLMFLRDHMLFFVTVNRDWLLQLPPLPLVAVVYGLAMVLLFGGMRLLRVTWFPVLFLWAVIPVPQTFSNAVDLPLQHSSAAVARWFAHLLGEHLTQDKLRLMFTPNFGMFIAPGCNGIRGAITLGLAALVVSYIYRFRWYVYAPVVVGAVMLGYLFNFVRLCTLVVYYKIALPYPWLQDRATGADYIIGACLFVCALMVFFTIANKLRKEEGPEDRAQRTEGAAGSGSARGYFAKVAAVLVLAGIFGFDSVKTHIAAVKTSSSAPALAPMPEHIGGYSLVRTWQDTLVDGVVVYTWGEYANTANPQAPHVDLGISPELSVHDAEICHMARGEEPTWHGQVHAPTANLPVDLTAAMYNDGTVQWLEASSVCDARGCRQFSETSRHVTLVYAYPRKSLPMQGDTNRQVPILLKAEVLDPMASVAVVRPQLEAALSQFLAGADLVNLTAPYSLRGSR